MFYYGNIRRIFLALELAPYTQNWPDGCILGPETDFQSHSGSIRYILFYPFAKESSGETDQRGRPRKEYMRDVEIDTGYQNYMELKRPTQNRNEEKN
ncbi:hypothetical protein M8J77_012274 [Diaphorina citri]|nr:hypothetical protein M8J77_012274 [Diaphorina citri]